MSWVFETPRLFSASLTTVLYHFFEIILVFWECIVLEQYSLLSPDLLRYVTTEHDLVLTATRSCFLLTVA